MNSGSTLKVQQFKHNVETILSILKVQKDKKELLEINGFAFLLINVSHARRQTQDEKIYIKTRH